MSSSGYFEYSFSNVSGIVLVAVRWVVVEQSKTLGARFARDVHRVVDRAMTPVALRAPFAGGVLRVVDQEVDAVETRMLAAAGSELGATLRA